MAVTPPTPARPPGSRPSRSRIALVLGAVSLASAAVILLGAVQRTGSLGSNPVWDAWVSADATARFVVVLTLMSGLLGAGAAAFTLTWKRHKHLDLMAASAMLVAGIAILVGATYQPQYGASQATALVMGGVLAAGFVAALLSAWKRWAPKATRAAEGDGPAEAKSEPQT